MGRVGSDRERGDRCGADVAEERSVVLVEEIHLGAVAKSELDERADNRVTGIGVEKRSADGVDVSTGEGERDCFGKGAAAANGQEVVAADVCGVGIHRAAEHVFGSDNSGVSAVS